MLLFLRLLCLQIMSEKVGGAEGTKLDEDFKDLERVNDKHFKGNILTSASTMCSFKLILKPLRVALCFNSCICLTVKSREQTLPAEQWWKSSIKHQSIFSPTQQQEPSSACSALYPKSVVRWRVQATPNPKASWESLCWSMEETWAMTPTLVRTFVDCCMGKKICIVKTIRGWETWCTVCIILREWNTLAIYTHGPPY